MKHICEIVEMLGISENELVGEMRTMPGLPTVPACANIDIDEEGRVVGLF